MSESFRMHRSVILSSLRRGIQTIDTLKILPSIEVSEKTLLKYLNRMEKSGDIWKERVGRSIYYSKVIGDPNSTEHLRAEDIEQFFDQDIDRSIKSGIGRAGISTVLAHNIVNYAKEHGKNESLFDWLSGERKNIVEELVDLRRRYIKPREGRGIGKRKWIHLSGTALQRVGLLRPPPKIETVIMGYPGRTIS